MPRRRVTIASLMLLVLFVGLVIALVRSELENRRLRADLEATMLSKLQDQIVSELDIYFDRREALGKEIEAISKAKVSAGDGPLHLGVGPDARDTP